MRHAIVTPPPHLPTIISRTDLRCQSLAASLLRSSPPHLLSPRTLPPSFCAGHAHLACPRSPSLPFKRMSTATVWLPKKQPLRWSLLGRAPGGGREAGLGTENWARGQSHQGLCQPRKGLLKLS